MGEKIKVTELTSLTNLPSDSVIITYSDHYKGNSGDDVFLTDNTGQLLRERPYLHWSENMDDRGLIWMRAITHDRGAFAALLEIRSVSHSYVEASQQLKDFQCGKYVHCSELDDTAILRTSPFEASSWYRRYANRSKKETVQANRQAFIAERANYNTAMLSHFEAKKNRAKKWFSDNGISVRVAYLITQQEYY